MKIIHTTWYPTSPTHKPTYLLPNPPKSTVLYLPAHLFLPLQTPSAKTSTLTMASIVIVGGVALAHHAYKSYKSHESKKMDILEAANKERGYSSDGSLGFRDGEHRLPSYEETLLTKKGRKSQRLRSMWPLSHMKETQRS